MEWLIKKKESYLLLLVIDRNLFTEIFKKVYEGVLAIRKTLLGKENNYNSEIWSTNTIKN